MGYSPEIVQQDKVQIKSEDCFQLITRLFCAPFNFLRQYQFMRTIERLEAIQHALKFLRVSMVILTTILLFISMVSPQASFLEAIVISTISLLLFLLKQLAPVTYRLFILLLTVNLIYSTGNFLQNLFSHKRMPIEYFIIKAYFITVHILLVLILWRHYQVEEGIFFFMKSRSNFNFNKQLDKSKIKIRVTTLIVFSRDWIQFQLEKCLGLIEGCNFIAYHFLFCCLFYARKINTE